MTVDRKTLHADGEDAAFCLVHFADANGNDDLFAGHTLKAEVSGAAALAAFASANPSSEERYDTADTVTFDGYAMAVVRTGETAGPITLTVTADNGETVQVDLTAE